MEKRPRLGSWIDSIDLRFEFTLVHSGHCIVVKDICLVDI